MANRNHAPTTGEGPEFGYIPPRNNVLLLSCMDARLIDELGALMGRDNLTNRYDHVVLAGASLGALQTAFPGWRETFFDHLKLAIDLHQVRDFYIVEHRNCGAYQKLLKTEYGDTPEEQDREERDHAANAFRLRDEILAWAGSEGGGAPLAVRCFLMDLRGHAKLLTPPPASGRAAAGKGRRSRSTPA